MKQVVNKEGFLFNPSQLISLYELDGSNIGLSVIYRFYAGTNEMNRPITFDGNEYMAFPVFAEGFEMDGKGSLPRPKISVSNINGFISNIILQNENIIGAVFKRIRVYARFLDAVNFPNGKNPYGTPDPEAGYTPDIFYINRKANENAQVVQFELISQIELENVSLPRRTILASICPFRFRDPASCGYAGAPLTDVNNKSFTLGYGFTLTDEGEYDPSATYNEGSYVYIESEMIKTLGEITLYVCKANGVTGIENGPLKKPENWLVDACSKSTLGCKIHFPNGTLPFGGFPGVGRATYTYLTR